MLEKQLSMQYAGVFICIYKLESPADHMTAWLLTYLLAWWPLPFTDGRAAGKEGWTQLQLCEMPCQAKFILCTIILVLSIKIVCFYCSNLYLEMYRIICQLVYHLQSSPSDISVPCVDILFVVSCAYSLVLKKVKWSIAVSGNHLTATGNHMPYGITFSLCVFFWSEWYKC